MFVKHYNLWWTKQIMYRQFISDDVTVVMIRSLLVNLFRNRSKVSLYFYGKSFSVWSWRKCSDVIFVCLRVWVCCVYVCAYVRESLYVCVCVYTNRMFEFACHGLHNIALQAEKWTWNSTVLFTSCGVLFSCRDISPTLCLWLPKNGVSKVEYVKGMNTLVLLLF